MHLQIIIALLLQAQDDMCGSFLLFPTKKKNVLKKTFCNKITFSSDLPNLELLQPWLMKLRARSSYTGKGSAIFCQRMYTGLLMGPRQWIHFSNQWSYEYLLARQRCNKIIPISSGPESRLWAPQVLV